MKNNDDDDDDGDRGVTGRYVGWSYGKKRENTK